MSLRFSIKGLKIYDEDETVSRNFTGFFLLNAVVGVCEPDLRLVWSGLVWSTDPPDGPRPAQGLPVHRPAR